MFTFLYYRDTKQITITSKVLVKPQCRDVRNAENDFFSGFKKFHCSYDLHVLVIYTRV